MKKVIYLLKDSEGMVLEVYDNKDIIKKILPSIENKLLTEIMSIDEVQVNPPIDLVGNKNFKRSFTIKEFMDYV